MSLSFSKIKNSNTYMRIYHALYILYIYIRKMIKPVVKSRLYCQTAENISGQRFGKTCSP